MYFEVNGKQVFATTGGKPFDNDKPTIIFLHGSGLDHIFWGPHSQGCLMALEFASRHAERLRSVSIVASEHMLPIEAPDQCRSLLQTFICAHNPAT